MGKVTNPPAQQAGLTAPGLLTPAHDLSAFNSGQPALDEWLRNHAAASEGHTARTYVVCEKAVVVGYYCIAMGSVERASLPAKMKRVQGLPRQIPVAILGRLARDVAYKGKGLGRDLLRDALCRILTASKIVGVRAVLVHAIDDDAARFWEDHEFIECPIGSRTFYLPIETIVTAL